MMRRILTSGALALCLVLTGLAAIVAETRMAAAGGYCGSGTPQILLDDAGLPLLDADGEAVAAPDCPICHLTVAMDEASGPICVRRTRVTALDVATELPTRPTSVRLSHQARAPPLVI